MGHWEDFWVDTDNSLTELGLYENFQKQLKKMNHQDKHKYKDTRARWEYAYAKVLNELRNKK